MGLSSQSTGAGILSNELKPGRKVSDKIVALGGNPNVGKSTVFNCLTGLNQHTGNWPGKTVSNAQGKYKHKDTEFILVDIPGTYSLMANSEEEEIARDFICFGNPDATVIVTDATCLERNLNLVLQTLEITSNVVVCVNLLDEARRKKIEIDLQKLSNLLKVPVIGTSARCNQGLDNLMDVVYDVTHHNVTFTPLQINYENLIEEAINLMEPTVSKFLEGQLNSRWVSIKLLDGDESILKSLKKHLNYDLIALNEISNKVLEASDLLKKSGISQDILRDKIVAAFIHKAEIIGSETITYHNKKYNHTDRKIDQILTSKLFGIPLMLGMLCVIFWLTLTGANYPSSKLSELLFWIQDRLTAFCYYLGTPDWVHGLFVLGMYRTMAWVISVMLPPMAIFFPLFTLLEDLGYLPRVAFNMDRFFKRACAHGKQALTMCMGFGCNAAGIIGCRIIDSPREKLIAMLTNNFVPCNGRFPTLIAIISMFFVGMILAPFQSILSAVLLTMVILIGIIMSLLISKLLSKTILKGLPSSFALELPPFRKPQIGKVIIRSMFDRTLFVLSRAIVVAAPAGMILWLVANIYVGDTNLLSHCAGFLDPFANLIGLDGYILMAFILGFPANEIVFPIIIMSYLSSGTILELSNLGQLKELLVANGWNWLTAICTMLFSLMHWPCGTTCLTIKKESGSWKWTTISILIPTLTGIVICFVVATCVRVLGLV